MSMVFLFSLVFNFAVSVNASEVTVSPPESVAFSCLVNDKTQVQGQINASENSGWVNGSFYPYPITTPIVERAFFDEKDVVVYAEKSEWGLYRIFFPRLTYTDKGGWPREVQLVLTFSPADSRSRCFASGKLDCTVNGQQRGCGEVTRTKGTLD